MPYYQFNSFTGRIAESTHPQPFYPISPNRLERVEAPKIMYATPDMKPAKVAPAASKTAARFSSTLTPKMIENMKKFQANNGLPVHLKGGPMDKVLLGTTVAMIGIGLCGTFQMIYELSFPKK